MLKASPQRGNFEKVKRLRKKHMLKASPQRGNFEKS